MNKVLLRADGDEKIGLGHIVRCLAIASMLQPHFSIAFAITEPSESVVEMIESSGIKVLRLPWESADSLFLSLVDKSEIVVLDGYHFSESFQLEVNNKAQGVVIIDDLADKNYYADIIINHGGKSLERVYANKTSAKLLLGFDYALLRETFLQAAKKERFIKSINSAFICMGGADPNNLTGKVLKATISSGLFQTINVLTGSAFRHEKELKEIIQEEHSISIVQESNVSAERVVELLQNSDVAICPASSVAIEAVCVKIGLIIGTFVSNQERLHDQLLDAGCAISVGDFNSITEESLVMAIKSVGNVASVNQLMGHQARTIDGNSGLRLIKEFKDISIC